MDWDHVHRALQNRQLDNPSDITLMLLFSLLTLFPLCAGTIYLNRRKTRWYFVVPLTLLMLYVLASIILGFMEFLPGGLALAPIQLSLLKLFYLCDGVIILLAYSFQTSYEGMNLILFFCIQPLIIVGLCIRSIRQQSKLHHYAKLTDSTERSH